MSRDNENTPHWAAHEVERYGIAVARIHDGVVADFTPPDRQRLRARLERDHDGDLEAMLHGAWLMGANAVRGAAVEFRICRICGCSDLKACEAGCSWVDDDLCSVCELAGGPDALPPIPDPPQRPAHSYAAKLDAVPLYWRLAALGAVVIGLFQGGFSLLNLPSTAAGLAGIVCLLAAGFTALSAIRLLLKGSQ